MKLKVLEQQLSVCKVESVPDDVWTTGLYFIGKTDEELSLVCETPVAPDDAIERDDGWRGFRIDGVLDFSLIGILSKISSVLAEASVGIFAVSTYNTDYILVKEANLEKGLTALEAAGYDVER